MLHILTQHTHTYFRIVHSFGDLVSTKRWVCGCLRDLANEPAAAIDDNSCLLLSIYIRSLSVSVRLHRVVCLPPVLAFLCHGGTAELFSFHTHYIQTCLHHLGILIGSPIAVPPATASGTLATRVWLVAGRPSQQVAAI